MRETILSNNLDVLALTETWHQTSSDICLRDAAPSDFAVADVFRESQPGYGRIAVLYSGLLRCNKVDLPPSKHLKLYALDLRLVVLPGCY